MKPGIAICTILLSSVLASCGGGGSDGGGGMPAPTEFTYQLRNALVASSQETVSREFSASGTSSGFTVTASGSVAGQPRGDLGTDLQSLARGGHGAAHRGTHGRIRPDDAAVRTRSVARAIEKERGIGEASFFNDLQRGLRTPAQHRYRPTLGVPTSPSVLSPQQ